jgi:hypothetical protein
MLILDTSYSTLAIQYQLQPNGSAKISYLKFEHPDIYASGYL